MRSAHIEEDPQLTKRAAPVSIGWISSIASIRTPILRIGANSNFTAVKSRLLRGEGTAQLYNCKVFAATQGDCHRAE